MNALAKLESRIQRNPRRLSTPIRTQLEQMTQQSTLSEMFVEISAAKRALAGLRGEERAAAESEVAELEAKAAAFEHKHAKAIAKSLELAHELTRVTKIEHQEHVRKAYEAYLDEGAARWAKACADYEAALLERAAVATVIDALSRQHDAGVPLLSVGFPSSLTHPDSDNAVARRMFDLHTKVQALAVQWKAELEL